MAIPSSSTPSSSRQSVYVPVPLRVGLVLHKGLLARDEGVSELVETAMEIASLLS
jgi:hypothetical protein